MRTHEERVLVAGLGSLNSDLSRYIIQVIEADHSGTRWPHTANDEAALALRMVQLAGQLEIHAKQLKEQDEDTPIVIDGTSTEQTGQPAAP